MSIQIVKMGPDRVRLGGEIPGARVLVVEIRPKGPSFTLAVFVRDRDDPKSPLMHLWPSEHVRADFFERWEEVLLSAGLDQIGECCLGRTSDLELIADVIDSTTIVLRSLSGEDLGN